METQDIFYFFDEQSSKDHHLFEILIFCNITNYFTATFDFEQVYIYIFFIYHYIYSLSDSFTISTDWLFDQSLFYSYYKNMKQLP